MADYTGGETPSYSTGTYRTITGRLNALQSEPPPSALKKVEVAFAKDRLSTPFYIEALEHSGWDVIRNETLSSELLEKAIYVFDGVPGTQAETLFLWDALRQSAGSDLTHLNPPRIETLNRLNADVPLVVLVEM